jgi:NADPH:quinone reductase-like Zn-dependent oxidoreductase
LKEEEEFDVATIKAVAVDPRATARLALTDVPVPTASPDQALVRVAAVSLNRGEVRRAQSAPAGFRPGWDLAGVVETAAADGSGPKTGARVVGILSSGAWAETVAVPTSQLAELPAAVTFSQAATLPVAGLTALHAVSKGGNVLARNVLITGASGGVGHLAIQLARASGARVVGLVRQAANASVARAAGADEVAVGDGAAPAAAYGPYHLIVESVGGKTLSEALGLLAPFGLCVTFGTSASGEVTFDATRFYGTSARLYGLRVFEEIKSDPASDGLARLALLVADGRLKPHVDVEAPWAEVGNIAQQLLDRRYPGKAVLRVS